MVFFASRHRVKNLPFLQKVWMTTVAYALKYLAGALVFLSDKFDEKVTLALLTNTRKGDVR